MTATYRLPTFQTNQPKMASTTRTQANNAKLALSDDLKLELDIETLVTEIADAAVEHAAYLADVQAAGEAVNPCNKLTEYLPTRVPPT